MRLSPVWLVCAVTKYTHEKFCTALLPILPLAATSSCWLVGGTQGVKNREAAPNFLVHHSIPLKGSPPLQERKQTLNWMRIWISLFFPLFFIVVWARLSPFLPHSLPPQPSPPPILHPAPLFGFVHVFFIQVPWLPFLLSLHYPLLPALWLLSVSS